MPMYTFHCLTCGSEFEQFLRPSEALKGARCPACGKHTGEQANDDSATSAGPACDLSKKT